jgi:hypothetical protein
MKRYFSIPLASIVFVVALSAGVHAQTSSTQRVVANIPFTFNVGDKTLPAGKYAITVLNPTSDRKVLQVRSMNGRSSAMILTNGVIGNLVDDAKLVFHRYNDRYFFAEAQLAGESTSLAAVWSKRERAERNAMIAARMNKNVIVITAE